MKIFDPKFYAQILCTVFLLSTPNNTLCTQQQFRRKKIEKKYLIYKKAEKRDLQRKAELQRKAIQYVQTQEELQLKKLKNYETFCIATSFIGAGAVILPFLLHEIAKRVYAEKS